MVWHNWGEWSVLSIARFRFDAECWLPGDSRVCKRMIEEGYLTLEESKTRRQKRKRHDHVAVARWGNAEALEGTAALFGPTMRAKFDRFNVI